MTEGIDKAIKIVAPLLPYIKKEFKYKVIFMERNYDSIHMSQENHEK